MLNAELYLRLLKILDELSARSREGAVILVEGKKDEEALRSLGIAGRIVKISQMRYSDIYDELREEDVVILTDWDEEGERIKNELKRVLCKADVQIREELIKTVGKFASKIEEIPTVLSLFEKNVKI